MNDLFKRRRPPRDITRGCFCGTPLQISIIVYISDLKHLKINDCYVYPDWAYALGWMMATSSVVVLLLCAVIQMYGTAGTFREVRVYLLHPSLTNQLL